MMQKPWFKVFIWFIATAFFFIASAIIISIFNPGPNENQIMKFMSGMMGAMGSLMGISMSIEHDSNLRMLITTSGYIIVPLIIVAILGAIFIRIRRS